MGLISWLVAVGCLFVGAAVSIWGFTEIEKTVAIWLVGVPGGIFLIVACGFEAQKYAANVQTPPLPPAVLLDQRPWVEIVEVGAGPLTYDGQGARLGVTAQVKSTGKTPALNIVLAGFIYLIGKDHMDVLGEQKKFCEELKNRRSTPSTVTLFKDRTAALSNSLPILKNDIDKLGEINPDNKKQVIFPVLIGCIDYVSSVDSAHHQTGFAYMVAVGTGPGKSIQTTVPNSGSAPLPAFDGAPRVIYPSDGDISADMISLTPWIGGGFFVN